MNVEVHGLNEVVSAMNRLPDNLFSGAKTAYRQAVLGAANKTKQNATNILKVRTGHLKQSIGQKVTGSSFATLKASVFSASMAGGQPVKYAPLHEFGGTVRAIDKYLSVPGGPYLNIPMSDNLTGAGVMRRPAREVFNAGGYIQKSRAGNWIVFDRDSKAMFYLKKSSTIPARLGMRDAADDEVPTLLQKLLDLVELD